MTGIIAVSGGEGFVGSELVRTLSAGGEVISIGSGQSIKVTGNVLEIGFKHQSLPAVLGRATTYVHAAGRIKGTRPELEAHNVRNISRYLKVLPKNLRHVIHLSSVNVFLHEKDEYGCTKMLGENLWRNSLFANRLTVLRPSLIYGPGDKKNIYRLIRLVQRFPILPVPVAGRIRPVFLQDVVDLVIAIIQQEPCMGKTYIVSGKEESDFQEMVHIIANHLNKQVICFPIPEFFLSNICRMADLVRLNNLAWRVRMFQMSKNWYDGDVWHYLPRENTPLEVGLGKCVESYLMDSQ